MGDTLNVPQGPELKIREGTEDNSKMFFFYYYLFNLFAGCETPSPWSFSPEHTKN